jgi:flavodoxin
MIRIALILAVLSMVISLDGNLYAQTKESTGQEGAKRVLIVYFSQTQTTEKLALEIQKELSGADILRIETESSYPTDYDTLTDVGKKELNDNVRPKLKPISVDISSYDVIFLGYPIWWGTFPMAVYTFLDTYDLAGKTIVPFCTHGGSGLSGTDDEIRKLEPNAKVLAGFAVSRSIVLNQSQDVLKGRVSEWLRSLSL